MKNTNAPGLSLQTTRTGKTPAVTLASSMNGNRPHATCQHRLQQMFRWLGLVTLLGFSMRFSADAQTIDFGTIFAGDTRVGETDKITYRYFPYGCMDVRATLMNPQTRREDNSPPFVFAESPSFRLCSVFGSKASKRVKVAFRPTTPGTFTRLLRVATSYGGDQWYTLIGRAEALPPLPLVHVDLQFTASGSDGSLERPYRTFTQGYDRLADCGTLRIRTGSYVGPLVLAKCMRLESYAGAVRLGGTAQTDALATDIGIELSPEAHLEPGPKSGATLQLSSVVRPADGALVLTFSGAPGQTYQVLSSVNLMAWEVWQGLDAEEGTVVIELPKAFHEPRRFFKIVELGVSQTP